jgi:hypothetical protein
LFILFFFIKQYYQKHTLNLYSDAVIVSALIGKNWLTFLKCGIKRTIKQKHQISRIGYDVFSGIDKVIKTIINKFLIG